MTHRFRALAATTVIAALAAGPTRAIEVSYDFIATVVQGPAPYLGQTGTGTFTYDNNQLVLLGGDVGEGNLLAEPPTTIGDPPIPVPPGTFGDYDFTFDFNGQTFTDPDAPLSFLNIREFDPISWGVVFEKDDIDDPGLLRISNVPANDAGFNLFDTNPADGTLEIGLIVEPIPLPASFWMLGAGVLGLGAWARRRRQTA